jgi:hypothetical protein
MHAVIEVAPTCRRRARALSFLEEGAVVEGDAVLGMQEASSTSYLHQQSGDACPAAYRSLL